MAGRTGVVVELPNLSAGAIPPGRFRATLDEVAAAWVEAPVFAESATRREIWSEWLEAVQALRGAVPVIAAWLGGSFLSPKLDPGDLDCVWVIDDVTLAATRLDLERARLTGLFAQNKLQSVGMRVDSYVLAWRRRPGAAPRDELDWQYLRYRGYWDDFWQRARSGPKGSEPTRADAVPSRGYLEVMLDGFPE